jgi:hypothetical protein
MSENRPADKVPTNACTGLRASLARQDDPGDAQEARRHRGVEPVSAVMQAIEIRPTCALCNLDRPNLLAKGYVAQHGYHSVAFEAAMPAAKTLAHARRFNSGKEI